MTKGGSIDPSKYKWWKELETIVSHRNLKNTKHFTKNWRLNFFLLKTEVYHRMLQCLVEFSWQSAYVIYDLVHRVIWQLRHNLLVPSSATWADRFNTVFTTLRSYSNLEHFRFVQRLQSLVETPLSHKLLTVSRHLCLNRFNSMNSVGVRRQHTGLSLGVFWIIGHKLSRYHCKSF